MLVADFIICHRATWYDFTDTASIGEENVCNSIEINVLILHGVNVYVHENLKTFVTHIFLHIVQYFVVL